MITSQDTNHLMQALSAAQGELQNPERNRKVTVKGTTKSGSPFSYDFHYATLDNILGMARPILAKNELAILQSVTQSDNPSEGTKGATVTVTTRLGHSSGQWAEDSMTAFVEAGELQKIGSAITYLRRYQITAMLGIAAEEDDDANVAQGNQVHGSDRTPRNGKTPEKKPPRANGKPAEGDPDKPGAHMDPFCAVRETIESAADCVKLDTIRERLLAAGEKGTFPVEQVKEGLHLAAIAWRRAPIGQQKSAILLAVSDDRLSWHEEVVQAGIGIGSFDQDYADELITLIAFRRKKLEEQEVPA